MTPKNRHDDLRAHHHQVLRRAAVLSLACVALAWLASADAAHAAENNL